MKLQLVTETYYDDRCNDRWPVSGVVTMLGSTSMIASSTTQHCLTLSTSAVGYVAMAHGPKTALAIKVVLVLVHSPIKSHEDIGGAKALAGNRQGSRRK